MRNAIIMAGVVVAACSSPVDDARVRFEELQKAGAPNSEVCAAGRDMLRAQAGGGRGKRYPEDRAIVDTACLVRDTFGGDMPSNLDDPIYAAKPDDVTGNATP